MCLKYTYAKISGLTLYLKKNLGIEICQFKKKIGKISVEKSLYATIFQSREISMKFMWVSTNSRDIAHFLHDGGGGFIHTF